MTDKRIFTEAADELRDYVAQERKKNADELIASLQARIRELEAELYVARNGWDERYAQARISHLAALEREREYVEALERIKLFNPSYEYSFENARSIAAEVLTKHAKGGGE